MLPAQGLVAMLLEEGQVGTGPFVPTLGLREEGSTGEPQTHHQTATQVIVLYYPCPRDRSLLYVCACVSMALWPPGTQLILMVARRSGHWGQRLCGQRARELLIASPSLSHWPWE